jgi:hypothetical protein
MPSKIDPYIDPYKANSTNPLWNAWYNMMRSDAPVCERWTIFYNFATDMAPHPGRGYVLGRRDFNPAVGYNPANCVWMTKSDFHRGYAHYPERRSDVNLLWEQSRRLITAIETSDRKELLEAYRLACRVNRHKPIK